MTTTQDTTLKAAIRAMRTDMMTLNVKMHEVELLLEEEKTSKTMEDMLWQPHSGDRYFFISGTGEVETGIWDGITADWRYYHYGNCHRTVEAAIRIAEHNAVANILSLVEEARKEQGL